MISLASALQGIIQGITSIVGFIQSFVSTLLGFFQMIPDVLSMVTSLIAALPKELAVFASASVAVAVLLFVIGR